MEFLVSKRNSCVISFFIRVIPLLNINSREISGGRETKKERHAYANFN